MASSMGFSNGMIGAIIAGRGAYPLPPGEGAAKRQVRDSQAVKIPHPALRAPFSRLEKVSL